MSTTDFYRAFEDRHRGSRELIRKRLEAYGPFIEPLLGIYQHAKAIDLGCGRGEWLELLLDRGFVPQGVDIDAGMLAACTERGLPVMQGDAIAQLKSLCDESQCIVSGFHIAEHIAFGDLETLVLQALRVLKPGGLLILETPNPENIVVGTSNFYVDPTHLRPIPPLLLSFLPEHHGFARVRTVRLQEPPELHQRSDICLMDVLGGVSPDYAIVAQKAATREILGCFDAVFAAPYGIELAELAGRFDSKLEMRIRGIDQRLANAEAISGGMTDALGRIGTLQDRLLEASTQLVRSQAELAQQKAETLRITQGIDKAQAQARAMESLAHEQAQRAAAAEASAHEQAQRAAAAEASAHEQAQRAAAAEASANSQLKRIEELGGNSHHWWLQACALEAERNALLQSGSWRITSPLRFVAGLALHPIHTVRNVGNRTLHSAINISHRPLSVLMAAVLRRPQLSHRINQWLQRYPALYQQLLGVARRGAVVPVVPEHVPVGVQANARPEQDEQASLTPRARRIYADLLAAIDKNKRSS